MDSVPREIVAQILSYVPKDDVIRAQRACRRFKSIINDPWYKLIPMNEIQISTRDQPETDQKIPIIEIVVNRKWACSVDCSNIGLMHIEPWAYEGKTDFFDLLIKKKKSIHCLKHIFDYLFAKGNVKELSVLHIYNPSILCVLAESVKHSPHLIYHILGGMGTPCRGIFYFPTLYNLFAAIAAQNINHKEYPALTYVWDPINYQESHLQSLTKLEPSFKKTEYFETAFGIRSLFLELLGSGNFADMYIGVSVGRGDDCLINYTNPQNVVTSDGIYQGEPSIFFEPLQNGFLSNCTLLAAIDFIFQRQGDLEILDLKEFLDWNFMCPILESIQISGRYIHLVSVSPLYTYCGALTQIVLAIGKQKRRSSEFPTLEIVCDDEYYVYFIAHSLFALTMTTSLFPRAYIQCSNILINVLIETIAMEWKKSPFDVFTFYIKVDIEYIGFRWYCDWLKLFFEVSKGGNVLHLEDPVTRSELMFKKRRGKYLPALLGFTTEIEMSARLHHLRWK